MFIQAHLRRIAVIALVGMFASVFAPLVTKLMAAHAPFDQFAEVCTAQGIVASLATAEDTGAFSKYGGDRDSGSNDRHPHGDDCPYCHLQLVKQMSARVAASLPLIAEPTYPTLFYRAPRPLFAWARMPARAPPTFL